jgi:hypothetical protein
MTRTKVAKAKPAQPGPNNAIQVHQAPDETGGKAIARAILRPAFRHATAAAQVNKAQFGSLEGGPGLGDYADVIGDMGKSAAKGDLAFVSKMLAAQAVTLDSIFTELARRMALNMGEHLNATDIYARHAMKAQAQSRATLEALAKIHQPREQTVKHVHVNEGGQAVVTDQFHHHSGGSENGKSNEQCHAAGSPGAGPALPSPNAIGDTVPIACGEGQATMPDAWRD